jgi:hypothetical protein
MMNIRLFYEEGFDNMAALRLSGVHAQIEAEKPEYLAHLSEKNLRPLSAGL